MKGNAGGGSSRATGQTDPQLPSIWDSWPQVGDSSEGAWRPGNSGGSRWHSLPSLPYNNNLEKSNRIK